MHCPQCGNQTIGKGRFCIQCGYDLSSLYGISALSILPPGFVLDRRYRVVEYATSGGMANIYKVEDKRLKGIYCLKEMIDRCNRQEERDECLARFQREAEILARLKHPAIPRIIDYFVENSKCYLVMDFIEGQDLETALVGVPYGRFPVKNVLNWFRQILDVLIYLHSQAPPIIYRDMKPSNLMITDDDRIYLVDFGIARLFAPARKGTLVGTPGYAPPEQYKGRMDARSDIYSLGATIHHLITGRDPQNEAPFSFPPVLSLNPQVGEILARIIDRCLCYEMEKRFQSVKALQQELEGVSGTPRKTDWFGLGLSCLRSGKLESAENAFTRALTENPTDVRAFINRGVTRVQRGNPTDALEDFEEAVNLAPDNPDVVYNLASALKNHGKLDRAIICFEKVLQLNPRHASACNNLGNIYSLFHYWDKALEYYQRALSIDPGLTLALENLKKAGERKTAESSVDSPQLTDPVKTFYNLGMNLIKWNRLDEAEEELMKALKLDRERPDPHQGLGLLYFQKGDYLKASRFFENALKLDSTREKLYRPLGICYMKTGRRIKALSCFDMGMERIIMNNSGWRNNTEYLALKKEMETVSDRGSSAVTYQEQAGESGGNRNLKNTFAGFLEKINILSPTRTGERSG